MLECVSALENSGVRCCVIKGIPLARQLYGQVHGRGIPADCDILVARKDVIRAVDTLISIGYSSPYLPASKELFGRVWKVVMRRASSDGSTSTLEIHLAPFSPWAHPISENLVWSHIVEDTSFDHPIWVPDHELNLVLLACHFAQSGFASPKILRDFHVAWALWSNEIDPLELLALIHASRARLQVVGMFRTTPHLDLESSELLDNGPTHNQTRTFEQVSWGFGFPRLNAVLKYFPTRNKMQIDSEPDYIGQLLALLIMPPKCFFSQVTSHLFPSRLALAIINDEPVQPLPRYLTKSANRLGAVGKALIESIGMPLSARVTCESLLEREM